MLYHRWTLHGYHGAYLEYGVYCGRRNLQSGGVSYE